MSTLPLEGTNNRIPLAKLIAALVFPLFMAIVYPASYLSAFSNPTPHNMPVEIIATSDQAQGLVQGLEIQAEDQVEATLVPDVETAIADVKSLTTRAAYDPATGELYLASAASKQTAQASQAIFQEVANQSQMTLTVKDLKPTVAKDSLGTGFMFLMMGGAIGGYVTATMLNTLARNLKLWKKILAQFAMAILAAIIVPNIIYNIYGIYDEHILPVAFIVGGTFMAVSLAMLGIASLLGQASTMVGILLFVVLGVPSSGAAIAVDMLPGFFSTLHNILPLGASTELFRRVIYFDDVGVGKPIMQLLLWAALGLGMLWVSSLKAPTDDEYSMDTPKHQKHAKDEPLLVAYEEDGQSETAPAPSASAPETAQA